MRARSVFLLNCVQQEDVNDISCRTELRQTTRECQELRRENETMNQSLYDIQKSFGHMLNNKSVEMDTLNDTISVEKDVLEKRLSQVNQLLDWHSFISIPLYQYHGVRDTVIGWISFLTEIVAKMYIRHPHHSYYSPLLCSYQM